MVKNFIIVHVGLMWKKYELYILLTGCPKSKEAKFIWISLFDLGHPVFFFSNWLKNGENYENLFCNEFSKTEKFTFFVIS